MIIIISDGRDLTFADRAQVFPKLVHDESQDKEHNKGTS